MSKNLVSIILATFLSFGFYNKLQESSDLSNNIQKCVHEFLFASQNSEINEKSSEIISNNKNSSISNRKPRFWFHERNSKHKLFKSVENVLERFGLEKIEMNLSEIHNDWDLIWSYQLHPLEKFDFDWKSLKYHQKINHIPGNFLLTSKMTFGTLTSSKYVPLAFNNSTDLQSFAKFHPNKRFVLKKLGNRGVKLVNLTSINFEIEENFFAQEFIEDPLLIEGHMFDVGIYVVITSVNPLRLYYYSQNLILRFCPKEYNLSDPSDVDRYVVADSRITAWNFKGTKKYFDAGFSAKDALDAVLKEKGANLESFWWEVEDCIRSIVSDKEKEFIYWQSRFGTSKYNHFELFRFDFIIDSNFHLHLIEVNQHPNIYPNADHAPNKPLYENLLFNLFNLISIGTSYPKSDFRIPNLSYEQMEIHPTSLTVQTEACVSKECEEKCDEICKFCQKCLSINEKYDMIQAYREQMKSGSFKRIFPPSKEFMTTVRSDYWRNLEAKSRKHAEWFVEMCKKDGKFC